MKRICSICARGGSKGVPGKNIKMLLEKPLIAYSIDQAKKSKMFDAIAVSSDSDSILEISKSLGADYIIKRSDELASDTAAKVPVIRDCVNQVEKISGIKFDLCVDLDCTSPLRNIADIQNSIKLIEEREGDNVITGTPSRRSPYFNLVEVHDDKVKLSKSTKNKVVRRQDAPETFDLNASIYIWRRKVLENNDSIFLDKTLLYIMPEERSIDIDSDIDFKLVELLMREKDVNKR